MFKNMYVFHYRRKRHAVGPGEIGNRGLAEHQCGEDGAAGGISECAEGGVQGCGIVNHMV